MRAQLQTMTAKFEALQPREKAVVAVALVFGILLLGHTLWVEPPQLKASTLRKQIAQQRTDLQMLQAQLPGMKTQIKDPDAGTKAAIAETKERIVQADRALKNYDTVLVPPSRVSQLLQSLFQRHRGLELVAMQTLPPAPLLAPSAPPKAEGKGAVAAVLPPVPGSTIQKHGIEIKVAGNYLDLLAYVTELERQPQKLLWDRMSLVVTGYPRSEMTLTVYTLSLDTAWLVV